MVISHINVTSRRSAALKLLVYACVFNLVTVIGLSFRMSWLSLVLDSTLQLGDGGQTECGFSDDPLLCIFTSFKPAAHKLPIYNDTLHNWVSLDDSCERKIRPIMFVANMTSSDTEEALVTSARHLGWSVLELPRTGTSGLPVLKDMYFETQRRFPYCTFYGFSNGDIVFNRGLITTLQAVSLQLDELGATMVIGRRTNVQWRSNETLQDPDNVTQIAAHRGRLFLPAAEDYFFVAMNSFPWHRVPPNMVIARPGYDNYIVAIAISNNVSVIDASATLLAVHMTDFEGNWAGTKNGNVNFNLQLLGRKFKYGTGKTSSAQYVTKMVRNMTDNTNYVVVSQRRRIPVRRRLSSIRSWQKVTKTVHRNSETHGQ